MMAHYDDLPIQRITVVGLISVAVTIITVLAVQVMYYGMQGYVDDAKFSTSTNRDSNEFLNRQTQAISRFGVDPATGSVTIPVQQAMKQMIDADNAAGKDDPTVTQTNDGA